MYLHGLLAFVAFLSVLNATKSHAQDTPEELAQKNAETTAIVYFRKDRAEDEKRSVLQVFGLTAKLEGEAKSRDWFVAPVPPQRARELLMRYSAIVDHIEENSVYHSFFLGCSSSHQPLPTPAIVPPGITRVGGPFEPAEDVAAWIVDTGVDTHTVGYLPGVNFDRAADCTGGACTEIDSSSANQVDDTNGHGTLIAGIIAAMPESDRGLSGVAPGAEIIPVKVSNANTINKADLQPAIDFVTSKALPGEVVNLSWGFIIEGTDAENYRTNDIERQLIAMAIKGVRVVVAAGNWDPSTSGSYATGGYVQLISPARIGSYIPAPSGTAQGGIFTVSSIDESDSFWINILSGSYFGNDPPSYAAPGVEVLSLWPNSRMKSCTGTSFSAAHLSGILLQSKTYLPVADGRAQGDPSAKDPYTGIPDATKEDPIASCTKTTDVCEPDP